jgi:hypothetical protein
MSTSRTASFSIEDRSQLIYALTEAAELEHLLMCQYLFSAFSMKSHLHELPNADRKFHQIELIRAWKQAILRIAREEMQHLTYANNLLIAVGGAPYFARPNFPSANRFYRSGPTSPGLEMSLESFRPDTVDRFIRFEEAAPQRLPLESLLAAVPDPNYYQSIGELYGAIDQAFDKVSIVDMFGEYDPFDESGDSIRLIRQPDMKNTVDNPEDAHKLIKMIVTEGEGSTSNDPQAHVNIFRRIRAELQQELKEDPKFEPARQVVSNPLVRWHDDIDSDLRSPKHIIDKATDDGLQYGLLQLFNGAYEILLNWLSQLFARQGSRAELNALQTLTFMPYMTEVVRPLGELLTRVPIQTGKTENLGASWEVTSNNFMVPKGKVTGLMTIERLTELSAASEKLCKLLDNKNLSAQATDLRFLQKTFANLLTEFQSRMKYGWPPKDNDTEATYSEATQKKSFWMSSKTVPPVLELEFQGWLQCRLATDVDGAHEPRGVTGNAFAIGSEPDLDRVIRLQPDGTTVRSHCPPIGVAVTAARVLESAQHAPQTGLPYPSLVGARVHLLGEPKFEGRNHLVSEDGEPIDPFDLLIEAGPGMKLRRSVDSRKSIVDMSPTERRGTGRYPVGVTATVLNFRENARRIGVVTSPRQYIEARINALKGDLDKVANPISEEAEALGFRIAVISQAITSPSIRWVRFFFDAAYYHSLSGPMDLDIEKIEPKISPIRPPGGAGPDPSRWAINYHIGLFDTDALSAYMFGILRIPLESFPGCKA